MAERDANQPQRGTAHVQPEDTKVSRRRPRRRRWRVTSRFFKLLLGVAFASLFLLYARVGWEIRTLQGRIEDVNAKIAIAHTRNERLQQELEFLSSDSYVEEMAREQLGLVKEGEKAYMVVTPDQIDAKFSVEKRLPEGVDFFDTQ